MALFEFQSRWAQLASGDLRDKEDELEARDAALEQFIRDFPCNAGSPLTLVSTHPIFGFSTSEVIDTVSEGTDFTIARVFVVFEDNITFDFETSFFFKSTGDEGTVFNAELFLTSVSSGVEYEFEINDDSLRLDPTFGTYSSAYFEAAFEGVATFTAVMAENGTTYTLPWFE